uniref:Secreted protein n=1 Tax=Haemonchus placei TaxID=6290 RepID=A0A0N4W155_HAEPC
LSNAFTAGTCAGVMRRSAVASLSNCSTICVLVTACSKVDGLSSFTKYLMSLRKRATNSSKTRSFRVAASCPAVAALTELRTRFAKVAEDSLGS